MGLGSAHCQKLNSLVPLYSTHGPLPLPSSGQGLHPPCSVSFVYFSDGQEHSPGPKPQGGGPRCPNCCGEEEERCCPRQHNAFIGHLSSNSGSRGLLQSHGLTGPQGAEIQGLLVLTANEEVVPVCVQLLEQVTVVCAET